MAIEGLVQEESQCCYHWESSRWVSSPAYSLGKSLQAYACHSGFGLTGSSDLPSKMAWASIASSFVGNWCLPIRAMYLKALVSFDGEVLWGLQQTNSFSACQ